MAPNPLNSKFWKIVFVIAGLYTAGGVLPGIFDPAKGVHDFTGQMTEDWNTLYFFRSLWIIVLVFGIGYFIVALNPAKHIGIVMLGFLGKLLFAANVMIQYSNERLSQMAFTASIIDSIFVLIFGVFIYRYYQYNQGT